MKTVEINTNFHRSYDSISLGDCVVLTTPPINEKYWLFRVKLYKDQAIIGFPKFGTIGIGFAIEDADWNTNLPFSYSAKVIYDHISENKKYEEISQNDALQAINLIKEMCKTFDNASEN